MYCVNKSVFDVIVFLSVILIDFVFVCDWQEIPCQYLTFSYMSMFA